MQFFQRSISNKRNAGPEGKDDVLSMIAGERIPVNTGSFTNDMTTFRTEDDVLTLLIHLGYLAYDSENKVVKIPNNEVRNEYVNSVAASDWGEVSIALKQSARLREKNIAEVWKNIMENFCWLELIMTKRQKNTAVR